MNRKKLRDFYLHRVLPALFEHLDRAFPEFSWTRTTIGWKAIRRTENGRPDPTRHQLITCHQPWGFVAADGTAVSWLSYVNGGESPTVDDFASAVNALAKRAQVATHVAVEGWSRAESQSAIEQQRQADLMEQFVAYCQVHLNTSVGQSILCGLRDGYGISVSDCRELSIGVYTTPQEVGEHLLGRGFTHDEILQSAVAGDHRLAGRLVVPWRDRWGQLKTIVARDVLRRQEFSRIDLYLKGGTRTGVFGLDVALRDSSEGKKHLVLVESILDVIYLQTLGVRNVATIAGQSKTPSSHHWQQLAQAGVSAVTFAVADSGTGGNQTIDALRELNKATTGPEVYVVTTGKFGDRQSAADYVRQHGLTHFRDLLKQRVHGYRYVAGDLVGRHRPAGGWNEASLTSMLVEAVNFDAEVNDPQRALQLERHFWPTIMETTGLDWESLRANLKNRHRNTLNDWQLCWNSRDLKQLLRDLRQALREDDYGRFRDLICSAARDLSDDGRSPAAPIEPRFRQRPTFSQYEQWRPLVVHQWAESSRTPFACLPTASDNGQHRWTRELPSASDVRALAYRLWEQNGRPSGRDQDFWIEAERKLGLQGRPNHEHQRDENGFRAA